MAVILGDALSGASLEQVAGVSPDIVYEIFGRELSMGNRMGLTGMMNLVAGFARSRIEQGASSSQPAPGATGPAPPPASPHSSPSTPFRAVTRATRTVRFTTAQGGLCGPTSGNKFSPPNCRYLVVDIVQTRSSSCVYSAR